MTRKEMFGQRCYMLPEEPLRNACALQMTVSENIARRTFARPAPRIRTAGGQLVCEAPVEKAAVKTMARGWPATERPGGAIQSPLPR